MAGFVGVLRFACLQSWNGPLVIFEVKGGRGEERGEFREDICTPVG